MMSMDLNNIGLGVATEKFQDELHKVIENIVDPNTEAKIKRRITLSFTFEPDPENRERCTFTLDSEAKLAKTRAYENIVQVGMDEEGNTDAMELMAQQQEMFTQPEQEHHRGKVVNMNQQ